MSETTIDAQATLDTWRQQGSDRMDPLRFERLAALARRTAGQHGTVRALLDTRLAEQMARYADDLTTVPVHRAPRTASAAPAARAGSALSILLDHLARQAAASDGIADDTTASPRPAFDRLDDVRRICAAVRSDSQLRQALEQAPENTGPLNSTRLVHRALTQMHDLSPEYLQTFMAYIDTLASVEAMAIGTAQDAKGVPSTAAIAKRPRAKPRSPRRA